MAEMPEQTETGLPQALAIAWGMVEAPQRGPSRGLSHERIVAAAVEIADVEGLAAVTMQRVAETLGFTTMALYRYVSSKEQLVTLMCDHACRFPPDLEIDGDNWRLGLRQWAEAVRRIYQAHPWILEIPRGITQVLMPNNMAIADAGLKALDRLAINDGERITMIMVLGIYVGAFCELEQTLAGEEYWMTPETAEALAGVVTEDRLPFVAPLFARGGLFGEEEGLENEFEFGLQRLTDGLAGFEPAV